MDHLPWIEKYRPRKLDEVTQDQNLIQLFKNNIKTESMTHLLFYGPPGTGKTSAILAIGRELFKEYFNTRVIEFNASDDRGINAVREKITMEAKKYVSTVICTDGSTIPSFKIIILDEADSMTDEAQDALRVIIEQYSTVTRFCFICNYISKITDAIKSRCSIVYFKKLNKKCMLNRLKLIAKSESIVLSDDIYHTIIEVANGDMRKAIMLLQNTKYLYFYKLHKHKSIKDMTVQELALYSDIPIEKKENNKWIIPNNPNSDIINSNDIYEIAGSITVAKAEEIISNIFKAKNIIDVSDYAKQIISWGYPVDNILSQLNNAILTYPNLDIRQRAIIIKRSGHIFLKIKECANEYIQLLDYLTNIYGIKHNLSSRINLTQ